MLPYYRILGVAPDASPNDVKKAYHRLARRFHPDHHGGHPMQEHRFRLVAEAYKVLGDTEARARYDRYGEASLVRRARDGVLGGVERFVSNLERVVEQRMKRIPKRGTDKRRVVKLSLRQACLGDIIALESVRHERCQACDGTRAEPGTSLEACHVCDGDGQMKRGSGLLATSETCPFCQGVGRIAPQPCVACDGLGETEIVRTLEVEVPPGVESGRRLVLRGHGEAGTAGGDSGDLLLDLEVTPHPLLTRSGADLRCAVPITFAEAIRGGTAMVPTLEGEPVRIRIPAGTQSGQSMRLPGRGAARRGGQRGDLYVDLEVETPALDPVAWGSLIDRIDQVSVHPRRAAYLRAIQDPTTR